MEILYFLSFLSFVMAMGGLAAFLWANQSGQFRDLRRPAEEMLFEDRPKSSQ
jgi:cbb3-type cytochrome oxidase maturation protein